MNDEKQVEEAAQVPVNDGADAPEQSDVDAFKEGAAAATPEPVKADEPENVEPEKAAAAQEVEPPKAENQAELTPEQASAAKVEDEIKHLDLKGQTAERFRELSKRPSEAEVAPLRQLAEQARTMQRVVEDCKASSEQVGRAFNYIKAFNSDDPKLWNAAFDGMYADLQWLAQKTGREIPGGADPLMSHKDLTEELNEGDLTRARALEIAQRRAFEASMAQAEQRRMQEQAQEAQRKQVVDAAIAQVSALNDRLKASDAQFAQKLEMLKPSLDVIRENLPPEKWAGAIEALYYKLPTVQAPTPVTPMPIRPTGSGAPMKREPKDDLEAFRMGMAQAS